MPQSPFSEAELHGLADGQIEAGRQAELLQRLRGHAFERARVEAWREQNELIRATFSGVETEPVPVSLSLTPPPRLQCIGGRQAPESDDPMGAPSFREPRRTARLVLALGALTGCTALVACWLTLDHRTMGWQQPALLLTATGSPPGMLATPAFDTGDHLPQQGFAMGQPRRAARDLPTSTIPDLSDSGFRFTKAAVQTSAATTLVFTYENDDGERLTLGVSRVPAERIEAARLNEGRRATTWSRHGTIYVLDGFIESRRLNAVAATLQAAQAANDIPD